MNLYETDLTLADRAACRRQYRTLRIAMYAPTTSPHGRLGVYQGSYGMTREEAKNFLMDFYREVSWHQYIGEK